MIDITDILTKTGKFAVDRIRQNLSSTGTNATTKTSQSVKYEVTSNGNKSRLIIHAKPYFMVVETGRKATPDKKPGREMLDNIAEWLRARGKEDTMKWAVAMKIQKEGTDLHKKGGRKDIVSNVINDEFIQSLKAEVLKYFGDAVMKSVIKIHKAA